MLVIGKPALFGSNNLPVRGQCQPHTQGWQLRIVKQGSEELLMTDTYYACRQVQLQCTGLGEEEIRKLVKEYGESVDGAGAEETQKLTPAELQAASPGEDATGLSSPQRPGHDTTVISRKRRGQEPSDPPKRKMDFDAID